MYLVPEVVLLAMMGRLKKKKKKNANVLCNYDLICFYSRYLRQYILFCTETISQKKIDIWLRIKLITVRVPCFLNNVPVLCI